MTDSTMVMVTGHRPPKIGGYDPRNELRTWVRDQLKIALSDISKEHDELIAISGVALGVDQDFAETALGMAIKVLAYVPGTFQPTNWPLRSQKEYFTLLGKIKDSGGEIRVPPNTDKYSSKLLMQRNADMVDDCDVAIAVWNGDHKSGTGHAVRLIQKAGKRCYHINPASRKSQWLSQSS